MVTILQKQLIEKTKTIRELNNNSKSGNIDDLIKQNNELQKMVGMLQQQLIEKTLALKSNDKTTRIPIEVVNTPTVRRNKSDPEVIVDINVV